MSCGNDFGSVCGNQNIVTEAYLSLHIFQGRASALGCLAHASGRPCLRELHWLQSPSGYNTNTRCWSTKLRSPGLASPYRAELCWLVVHLSTSTPEVGHLRQTRRAADSHSIGRKNFAFSGPETWNSSPAELRPPSVDTVHGYAFHDARKRKTPLCLQRVWLRSCAVL